MKEKAIKRKTSTSPNYPRHSLEKSLRIPKGILEQNAGKECSDKDTAAFLGVKYNGGPYSSELSSSIKFGLLSRPSAGRVALTDIARKILKPQDSDQALNGLREAVLKAPVISEVYTHYRGENLPDALFFKNALTDTFKIPIDKVNEFISIFTETLKKAELISENEGKLRVLDISSETSAKQKTQQVFNQLEKTTKIKSGDSCFVMMPFANPIGSYYDKVFKSAIEKAGLIPIRADNEIFGTGKIIDQIWSGIKSAKVLVAVLTDRNPNVFYELGLAHALDKPVVLVSSSERDVPFDLHHIRVIYYDLTDPFWGSQLIDKVAENILSAIKNPAEAIFKSEIN